MMSVTIWPTGLSASGKTTLASNLAEHLSALNLTCKIIDGDELRGGLCSDLGYARDDRRENIRRASEVCRMLNSVGVISIAALISPYKEDLELARRIIGASAFREVWLAAPLDVCEVLDPKGLYRRARNGELAEFTGISSPYEPPTYADLVLDTHLLGVEACVRRIRGLLNIQ